MELTQIVVYAIPAGETERYCEQIMSSHCKTLADIDRVKAAASRDGWHSFRAVSIDLTRAPDFGKSVAI